MQSAKPLVSDWRRQQGDVPRPLIGYPAEWSWSVRNRAALLLASFNIPPAYFNEIPRLGLFIIQVMMRHQRHSADKVRKRVHAVHTTCSESSSAEEASHRPISSSECVCLTPQISTISRFSSPVGQQFTNLSTSQVKNPKLKRWPLVFSCKLRRLSQGCTGRAISAEWGIIRQISRHFHVPEKPDDR